MALAVRPAKEPRLRPQHLRRIQEKDVGQNPDIERANIME